MAIFGNKKKKIAKLEDTIDILRHKIEELTQIVKTQELLNLRRENARLKEKEQLIANVHLKLKDIAYIYEDDFVLVKYEAPSLKVTFNADGSVQKNDAFFAINKLQLLSFNDMKKIGKVIEEVKKQKGDKK